ncbi:MAG: hypothetical protein ABW106_05815 [Steroidobacteraceae bacterium]
MNRLALIGILAGGMAFLTGCIGETADPAMQGPPTPPVGMTPVPPAAPPPPAPESSDDIEVEFVLAYDENGPVTATLLAM